MTTSTLSSRLELKLLRTASATLVQASPHIGVDLVDSRQFRRQLAVGGERLAARFFTIDELKFCAGDIDRLAVTVAAKEAVAKALGTGIRAGLRWTDIEIPREPGGRPFVRLYAAAGRRAAELGLREVVVSLCHEGPLAVAIASGVPVEVVK